MGVHNMIGLILGQYRPSVHIFNNDLINLHNTWSDDAIDIAACMRERVCVCKNPNIHFYTL